jgi:hypothetical protein
MLAMALTGLISGVAWGQAPRGGCCGSCCCGAASAGPAVAAPVKAPAAGDHDAIWTLLTRHQAVTRTVEELPDGVRTVTTTSDPELVPVLRRHVRQMAARVEEGRPIRVWDPVFRGVFANAEKVRIEPRDIEGGIEVVETSDDPEVVKLIQAHAAKVNAFVAGGHAAARPPWAGRGRGAGMGPGRGPGLGPGRGRGEGR